MGEMVCSGNTFAENVDIASMCSSCVNLWLKQWVISRSQMRFKSIIIMRELCWIRS